LKTTFIALLALAVVLAVIALPVVYGQSGAEYTWNRYRPLIGGIRVTTVVYFYNDYGYFESTAWSTLSYPVIRNSDNQVGVIIAGHAIYEVPGTPDYAWVFQPNFTAWDYSAILNYINITTLANVNVSGDFAFVPYQNVAPKLLYITQDFNPRPIQLYINSTVRWSDLFNGTYVYKTGENTSTTSGWMRDKHENCTFQDIHTGNKYVYYYCIYVDIVTLPGDSGAPLYEYYAGRDGSRWVGLVGHLLGRTVETNLAVFISVEAIYQSGYTPLTAG
jgi:V8-like Glu-specific endopeptidase